MPELEKQVRDNTERSLSSEQFINETLPLMFERIEGSVERVEGVSKKSLDILENGIVEALTETNRRLQEHLDNCKEEDDGKEKRKGMFARMPVYKKVIAAGAIIGVMFRPEIKELATLLIKWYFGIEL